MHAAGVARFKLPEHLELVEVPDPKPEPGWVVLEVTYAGICGTDLHIAHNSFPSWPPVTLGHEFCGRVADVGAEVEGWAAGDRVVLTCPVTPDLHQPFGLVHGGVYAALAETAASVGGALWFGDQGKVVGVSNHTDFLRAVRGGRLRTEATPLARGRTTQLW